MQPYPDGRPDGLSRGAKVSILTEPTRNRKIWRKCCRDAVHCSPPQSERSSRPTRSRFDTLSSSNRSKPRGLTQAMRAARARARGMRDEAQRMHNA